MQHRHAHIHPRAPLPPARPGGGRGYVLAGRLLLALLLAGGGGFAVYYAGSLMLKALAPEPEQKKVVEVPIKDAEWLELVGGLEKLSRDYRGRVGIYIKDLETGKTWDYNSDRKFPSASLIKVPIMAAVFEKIRAGQLSLDTQIKLNRGYRVGGSGSLKWVRDGTSLSVMEIVYKMITESDNTATKMLIDSVGMDYLAAAFRAMDLEHTNITPEGMSLTSRPVKRENYTTAREMGGLLERIYAGKLVDKASSEFMLDVLKHTKSRTRLRRGLPLGWEIGHKTGLLRKSCHDVGIVFSPRGDFVIAVLTSEVPSYSSAKTFISKVAKLTYRYYKIDSEYAGDTGAEKAG